MRVTDRDDERFEGVTVVSRQTFPLHSTSIARHHQSRQGIAHETDRNARLTLRAPRSHLRQTPWHRPRTRVGLGVPPLRAIPADQPGGQSPHTDPRRRRGPDGLDPHPRLPRSQLRQKPAANRPKTTRPSPAPDRPQPRRLRKSRAALL